MPEATLVAHEEADLPVVTLASLVTEYGGFSFAKIDCELCEFPFLSSGPFDKVGRIHGEYHAPIDPILLALEPTHRVTYDNHIPGAFQAVPR